MLTRYVKIIGLIAALSVFSGCGMFSQRETMLDKNWGTSLETAKQSQIFGPCCRVGWAGGSGRYRTIQERVQREATGTKNGVHNRNQIRRMA
jgi:hypothetical protein